MFKKNKSVKCLDGFTVSVQASSFNYCDPRTDTGPYTSVELGYPSAADDLIMKYAEDDRDRLRVGALLHCKLADCQAWRHGRGRATRGSPGAEAYGRIKLS